MKKSILLISVLLAAVLLFAGCGGSKTKADSVITDNDFAEFEEITELEELDDVEFLEELEELEQLISELDEID